MTETTEQQQLAQVINLFRDCTNLQFGQLYENVNMLNSQLLAYASRIDQQLMQMQRDMIDAQKEIINLRLELAKYASLNQQPRIHGIFHPPTTNISPPTNITNHGNPYVVPKQTTTSTNMNTTAKNPPAFSFGVSPKLNAVAL